MNENLVKHLISCGIPADKAREIASTAPGEPGVPTDNLTKALADMRSTFERERTDGEALSKALRHAETAEAARDAIQTAADQVLAEVTEQNESICKSLIAFGDTLKGISDALGALRDENVTLREVNETMAERLNKALGQPRAPKGEQITLGDILTPPGERPDRTQPEDPETPADKVALHGKLSKAIQNEVHKATPSRRRELQDAALQLDSGVDPDVIRKSFSINVG